MQVLKATAMTSCIYTIIQYRFIVWVAERYTTHMREAYTSAADEIRESGREERPGGWCGCGWWCWGWLGSVEHGTSHYAELQGAVICYCAQLSVKSPRRAERAQISSFPSSSVPASPSPPPQISIQPSIFAPTSLGPGSSLGWGAAGQLQASAGTCLGSFLQACPASVQKYYPILLSHLFLDSECWHQLQTQKKALNDKIFCIISLFVQLTRIYFQSLSQQYLFCLRLACHFFCLVSVLLITLL